MKLFFKPSSYAWLGHFYFAEIGEQITKKVEKWDYNSATSASEKKSSPVSLGLYFETNSTLPKKQHVSQFLNLN